MKSLRPRLAPTLVLLVLLPLMITLGFWQLDRGAQKQQLLDTWAAHREAAPMLGTDLSTLADPDFRRVTLRGTFDPDHTLLLDNRQRDGQVGIELLQPFHDQPSGLWVLINRGWLPWPDRRTPPTYTTPSQPLTLQAWIYVAPGSAFQLGDAAPTGQWPRLVTAVEPATLWTQLGRTGFVQELRLDPGPAAYRLDWPVVNMGPEKHLGYAVQWFAMSSALVVLYLYLAWHDYKKETPHGRGTEPAERT